MKLKHRFARWLLRDAAHRRIDAVHLLDAIHNELAGTDDRATEQALYRLKDHVGRMEWKP